VAGEPHSGQEKENKMRKFLGILALSISATAVAYASPSPPPQQNSAYTSTTLASWQSSQHGSYLQALDNYLDQFGGWLGTWGQQLDNQVDQALADSDDSASHGSGPAAAPEFDPAGAMAALTLLAGGLAVLRGRRAPK
jgi:hypothetical protein